MNAPTIECSRVRACRWKGQHKDLVKVRNEKDSKEYGMEINDMVCPKCGCNTYYEIQEAST